MLIVITGPDGAGKTTAARTLVEQLNHYGARARFCSIWDSREYSSFFKNQNEVQAYLATVTPHARMLFLAHAMSVSLELARASGAEFIVTDSYVYKYLASEIAYGLPVVHAEAIGRTFAEPDIVFYLNARAETAAARKGEKLSEYESGLSGGSRSNGFKMMQQKTKAAWVIVRNLFGPWADIDAGQAPEHVARELLSQLSRREWLARYPALTL